MLPLDGPAICLAIPAEVAGAGTAAIGQAERPRVVEIGLPVTLDGRYLGDLAIRIEGDAASFDAERFLALIQPDITLPTLEAVRARVAGGRLTPAAASTQELEVRYDAGLQELIVTSRLSVRNRRVIQLQTNASADRSGLEAPAGFSLFLNGALAYEHVVEDRSNAGNRGRRPLAGAVEIGGRIGGDRGVAFISRHAYQEDADRPFQRLETQFVYDDIGRLLRVTAGDLRYRGANAQGLPRIAGLSIERFFGLEPTRVFRPVSETSFDLERPSTVQVRINGLNFQELYLPAGRYDLRDLPLTQGANNVELVVRDDTGREQIIGGRNFFDFDLLQPGLSDFSLAAGVRSRFDNGLLRYGDDWVLSGFYRRGFSPTLTGGVDVQADRRGVTVGAAAVWASPLGVFRAQGAYSSRKRIGSGFIAGLGYFTTGRFGRDWRWSARIDAQYQSVNFGTIADLEPPPPGLFLRESAARVSGNVQVNNRRLTFTATGEYETIRGTGGNRAAALVGVTYNLSSTLNVGAFARHVDLGVRSDSGVFAQLTWTPGRNRLARASYDSIRGEAEVNYRYSPAPVVGATSYELGLRRNTAFDQVNLSGRLAHIGNRFEAQVQHDVYATADFASRERVQVSRASVATSVVFAGGRLALSRPVREGFAILTRHPSLEEKTVLVDPTESGVRARTDFLGAAVVPDLSSYNRGALYIDVRDLAPGYDLGSGQFNLRAPLYSGYRLTVGSAASVTVLAMVRRANGEPLALAGGTLTALTTPQVDPIPVFTNRNGRLAGVGLRPGRYRLTLFTTPEFTTEIEIPEGATSLVNIGEIRTNQP